MFNIGYGGGDWHGIFKKHYCETDNFIGCGLMRIYFDILLD